MSNVRPSQAINDTGLVSVIAQNGARRWRSSYDRAGGCPIA